MTLKASLSEKLKDIIKEISYEKQKAKTFPNYALKMEILEEAQRKGIGQEEAWEGLEKLKENKEVITGPTINDIYFKF